MPNEEHWTGTRVFRRWMQIPEKIQWLRDRRDRRRIDGSCVLAVRGRLTITVFSNGAIVYRGNDDDILPCF